MRKSDRWFNTKATQDTTSRVSTLPVLARVGPDNNSEPTNDRNDKNEKYFEVGKSLIGDAEVVG